MTRPTHFLFTALALIAFSIPPANAQQKAPAAALDLQDGDTFVFLGDSITHQCAYTQFVENFFYTRYPDRRIRFHNAGVSGDRAMDAINRFDEDVAAFKPKYVSLLLGMNDGQYEPFDTEVFDRYARGMTFLVEEIQKIGAQPIVFTPTMFDHHQRNLRMDDETFRFRDRDFSERYNALLAYYGGWLREQAGERGLLFVNQWGPMNDLTFAQRRSKPDFTLVPDAIHPGPAGHFLMAYEFLWQATPDRRTVSSIGITRAGEKWRAAGREVTALVVSPESDRVTFTHLARSLPWVVPDQTYGEDENEKWGAEPSAKTGYELTKAGHRLSNERLKIAGLAPGRYEVRIDGTPVAEITHIQLGTKIELQANEKTPQYQQSLAVANLNLQRNNEAIRPLRNLWSKIKGLHRKHENDEAAFAAEFEKLKPEIEKLQNLAREFEDQIYAKAQPVPRKYEIVKVK